MGSGMPMLYESNVGSREGRALSDIRVCQSRQEQLESLDGEAVARYRCKNVNRI